MGSDIAIIIYMKLWLVVIFVVLLFLLGYFSVVRFVDPSSLEYPSTMCKLIGREWVRGGWGQYRCLKVFSDGGKTCTSSAECQGECVYFGGDADSPRFVCEREGYGWNPIERYQKELEEGRKPMILVE